jgi:hypothetical protein
VPLLHGTWAAIVVFVLSVGLYSDIKNELVSRLQSEFKKDIEMQPKRDVLRYDMLRDHFKTLAYRA